MELVSNYYHINVINNLIPDVVDDESTTHFDVYNTDNESVINYYKCLVTFDKSSDAFKELWSSIYEFYNKKN